MNVVNRLLSVILVVVLSADMVAGQTLPCEVQELTGSNAVGNDQLGSSVAIQGVFAVAGAPQTDFFGKNPGSAYVYRFDSAGFAWVEEQVLIPSDSVNGDRFGSSAAIDGSDGDVMVVGSPHNGVYGGEGAEAAYVFRFDGVPGVWHEEQKLVASDGSLGDVFGSSVAIHDDVILVGAPGRGGPANFAGAAYVFRYDPTMGQWVETQKLMASDAVLSGVFGIAVSVHGDVLVIGSSGADGVEEESGAAYVFQFDPITDAWIEKQKLTASDGAEQDDFGESVSMDDGVILVGAPRDDDAGTRSGSAYVFRRDGASGMWVEEAKLTASDGAVYDEFGKSVAVKGTMAIVGAWHDDDLGVWSGSAYAFVFDPDVSGWVEQIRLTASNGESADQFGRAVAADESHAMIGAFATDGACPGDPSCDSGSVYAFAVIGSDTDMDGVQDDCDNCVATPNADQSDFDGDGTGDVCDEDLDGDGVSNDLDNCPTIPNVDQADADGDGVGDVCEDDDDDGVVNALDNCPADANPDQTDTDEDDMGDVCDSDDDGDDVDDVLDNCPLVFNPDQFDFDADGLGNACDPDDDGDGVLDEEDNCPNIPNADQMDTDGNGAGDACQSLELACEFQMLTASDADPQDWFGLGMAVQGDLAVIGALRADTANPNNPDCWSGAAYVLRYDPDRAGWFEEQKLVAAGLVCGDFFGGALVIEENVIVVGADEFSSLGPGAAYVFRYRPLTSEWVEEAKLMASDGDSRDAFGESVSLGHDSTGNEFVLVGAPFHDLAGDASGAMYVFEHSGDAWTQVAQLSPSDAAAHDQFAASHSLSGEHVVIGTSRDDDACPDDEQCNSGAVYVFRRVGPGGSEWVEEQKLTASDAAAGDQFGASVSLQGDTVVVGAVRTAQLGNSTGSAYVFGNTLDPSMGWVEEQKLTAIGASAGDQFGGSVSLEGDTIIVGARETPGGGAAYVFRHDARGWGEHTMLTKPNAESGERFGWTVGLSDGMALVGAPQDSFGGMAGPGSAYVFTLVGVDGDGDQVLDDCDNCLGVFNPFQGDCNADGVGDVCIGPGDFDGDGSVGMFDFAEFLDCFGGVGVSPDPGEPSCVNACLFAFDFDGDDDVDWHDFGSLQTVFAGP